MNFVEFPAIIPSSMDFVAPRFPVGSDTSLGGISTRRKYGNRQYDGRLTLEFRNIPNSMCANVLLAHFYSKGLMPIAFREDFFRGAGDDLKPFLDGSAYQGLLWYFIEDSPPRINRVEGGAEISNISLELSAKLVLDGEGSSGGIIVPLPPGGGGGGGGGVDTSPYVTGVGAESPIVSSGGKTPEISILPATQNRSGSMSAGDKAKLDSIEFGAQENVPTNLGYVASDRLLESSTGDDVILPIFTATTAGLVPLSGGGATKYLRADGEWAQPPGGNTDLGYTPSERLLTSSTGTGVTLPVFTDEEAGLTPASGGGTTSFLRADGTWAEPPGNGVIPGDAILDVIYESAETITAVVNATVPTVNPTQITNFDASGSTFDEGHIVVEIGFNVNIYGFLYESVYINSNSYFTFGGIVDDYGYDSYLEWASAVPYPGVFIGTYDGGLQLIKSTGPIGTVGQRTNTIRFQGSANHAVLDPNLSDVIWEITFRENHPSKILLKIIAFNDEGGTEGTDFFTFVNAIKSADPDALVTPFTCVAGAQYEISCESSREIRVRALQVDPAGSWDTDLSYTPSTRLLESSTGSDVTLPLLSDSDPGLAPASGGGTTNFLRADGTWAEPPSGGGSITGQTLTHVTGLLTAGAFEDFTLTEQQLFHLLSFTASTPTWIRIYGTSAARSADTRTGPGGTLPAPGTEFYAELVTTAAPQTIRLSPVPLVQPTSGEVFVRVKNMDTVSRVITLGLSALVLVD